MHVAEVGTDGVVFTVKAGGERASVQLRMLGRHNVPNALAAIAVGLRSGMSLAESRRRWASACGGPARRGPEWRGATMINDCYNSNPRR